MSDSPEEIPTEPDPFRFDPEIAALLDFEPVPRRARVDGWDEEKQRAFIVALAMTGSPSRAAHAIGMTDSGVESLRKGKGAEGFSAAWDGALALHARRRSQRLRSDLSRLSSPAFAGEGDHAQHGGGAFFEGEGADDPAAADELADALLKKFVIKVRQERKERLAGRIAEADFYLRQISFFEVALELHTTDAIDALESLRREGCSILEIADTEATRHLDRARRHAWMMFELERRGHSAPGFPGEGDHPKGGGGGTEGEEADEDLDLFPSHLLVEGEDFRFEPLPFPPFNRPAEGYDYDAWADLNEDQRKRAYDDQYARAAAEEQVKWEQEILTIARATKKMIESGGPDPWAD